MKAKLVRTTIFFSLVCALLVLTAWAQDKPEKKEEIKLPLLSARDTLRIAQVASPRLSPDGKWLLYAKGIRDMEEEDMKITTHIWRVHTDGSDRRQMTFGSSDCTSSAWFPDGKKIAFLSVRGKTAGSSQAGGQQGSGSKSQIFFMYGDGGEAWQVTEHKEGIQSFEISSDGENILFIAPDSLDEKEEKKQKQKDDAEEVDEKFRMSHIWVYNLESEKTERLTEGQFTVSDAHWSPDGRQIVYVLRPNPTMENRNHSDIYVVDVVDKKPRKLYDNSGRDVSPRWSPDGKRIAFASNPHVGDNTLYNKLLLISGGGGVPEVFLQDFNLDFGPPLWAADGSAIYWSTGDRTSMTLFSMNLSSKEIETLSVPRGMNIQWELSKDGKHWTWLHSGSKSPMEVFIADMNFQNPKQLSDANPWLREEKIKIADVKVIKWKNGDGQWIEGVLTFPIDYQPGKKYPLILNPHGGPSGAVMENFSAINQFLAANGFMILQPNFRGSSNYGQEFLNANRDYWGIRDYDDCMTGVDHCIQEGLADPERLICYGWSYGGYMSFWIVTQTDRFKAVSPGAGLSNLYSMYSTTDIPHYLGWFFGTPWDKEETYLKLSPIRHVKKVKSPVLILHGANDARVPPEQAVEFYRALKDLGKDVTFVRYPREGHGIREPRHQLDRLRRYLHFFSKHVNLTPVTDKE